ncbi:MAG: TetR family transcriptional regulator [Pseudomonadota bacterium]
MSELSPPQQQRSRETLNAISEATKRLLQKHTFAELTIEQIIKDAGSSTGSFYARFKGKRALLHHIHEEHAEASRRNVQQFVDAMAGRRLSLEAFTELWIPEVVQTHFENRGLFRATMIETLEDPEFAIRGGKTVRYVSSRLAKIVANPWDTEDAHIRNIEQSMRAVMAILDQDLLYVRQDRLRKLSAERVNRLKRIFRASMTPDLP